MPKRHPLRPHQELRSAHQSLACSRLRTGTYVPEGRARELQEGA